MVLTVLLVKDARQDWPNSGQMNVVEHNIPLQNVDSYGRYSDNSEGRDDTLLIMKSGFRYRLRMPSGEFHQIYTDWQTKHMVYLNVN